MRIRLFLAGVMLSLLAGCGMGEKTDLLFECASPDGSKIATLYRVSTGEREVDRQTRLNMRPATSAFNDSMFSFSMLHGHDAIIRWISNDRMEFVYPRDSILTHRENVIFGTSQTFSSTEQIQVTYRERDSTHGYFLVEKRCFNE